MKTFIKWIKEINEAEFDHSWLARSGLKGKTHGF